MKKIAILVPDLSLGGGQRVAVNTAHFLAKQNMVHIVMFSDEEKLFETEVKAIHLNCPKQHSLMGKLSNIYKRVRAFKALQQKENYDTIISFLESANLCAFLSYPKKSILTIHTKPELLTRFDQLILRHLLKFSSNLVAVSSGLKSELETHYKLKNVSVINNAIDSKHVQNMADDEAFKHPRKYLVSAGRLSEVKRYDVMIDAFYASKASDQYDLIIIGGGEDHEKLKNKIKPDTNKVHFIGEMKNPFPVIKMAELFLLSSRIEAFPMVLLESLSLETPVVAYNCPTGLEDIITHNENGLLIQNNDFNNLVNSIDKFIFDQELQASLRKNCLSSVEKYNPRYINADWEAYINRA